MGKLKDRSGEIYWPWHVDFHVEKIRRSNKVAHVWSCTCVSCGRKRKIDASRLTSGYPICACGINKKQRPVKHGMCGTPTYQSWQAMKSRCLNTSDISYKNYGGKGIKICDTWIDSFEKFFKDMGERPSKSHTIDRIDVHENYCQENCKWSTPLEQANNRSDNRIINLNGIEKTMSQWAREKGMTKEMLKHRIDSGWPIDKALSEPPMRGKRTYSKKETNGNR